MLKPRTLARSLPDIPIYLEVRSMLLSGESEITGNERNFIVSSTEAALHGVVGAPPRNALKQVLERRPGGNFGQGATVLCQPESRVCLQSVLPDWNFEEILVLVRQPQAAAVTVREPASSLQLGEDLAHLPIELQRDMEFVRTRRKIHVARHQALPVSFAYSPWTTETLADVSVVTVAQWQRQGFAVSACGALLTDLENEGLRPVWGSSASNAPSLGLARKLGFEPAGTIIRIKRFPSS